MRKIVEKEDWLKKTQKHDLKKTPQEKVET